MAIVGYARVSTKDQNLDLQFDALRKVGCERIFSDFGVSGSKRNRPEWDKCQASLMPGDKLVVYKLDRMGRSLRNLLEIIDNFKERGIHFVSVSDNIDTSTPMGNLIFNVMASFAEYEKELIRERVLAGLCAAKKRGKTLGRPRVISDNLEDVFKHYHWAEGMPILEAAKLAGISRSSAYRIKGSVEKEIL